MGPDSPSLFELFALSILTGEPAPEVIRIDQQQLFRRTMAKLGYIDERTGAINPEGVTFGELLTQTYKPFVLPKGSLDRWFTVGNKRRTKIRAIQRGDPVLFFVSLPGPSFKTDTVDDILMTDGVMYRIAHHLGEIELETLRLIHDAVYDGDDYPYDCWSLQRRGLSYLGRSTEALCQSMKIGDRFHHVLTDRANWILQLSGHASTDGRVETTLRFYVTNSERQAFVDGVDWVRFKLAPIVTLIRQEESFETNSRDGALVKVSRPDYYDPKENLQNASFVMNPVGVIRQTTDYGSRYIAMIAAQAPSQPIDVWPLDSVSPWLMHHPGGTLDEFAEAGAPYSLTRLHALRLEEVILVSLHMVPHSE